MSKCSVDGDVSMKNWHMLEVISPFVADGTCTVRVRKQVLVTPDGVPHVHDTHLISEIDRPVLKEC